VVTEGVLKTTVDNAGFAVASNYLPLTGGNITGNLNVSANVGIGTTSPNFKLESSIAGSNAVVTGVRVTNSANASGTAGQGSQYGFANDNGWGTGLSASVRSQIDNVNNGGSNISLLTYNGTSLTENMRITSLGNVGIGTTIPDTLLHIDRSVSGINTLLRIRNSFSTTSASHGSAIDFDGFYKNARISAFGNPQSSVEGTLSFSTNNDSNVITERMRITGLGNVGIGTTSPDHKLTISGGLLQINDTAGSTTTGKFGVYSFGGIFEINPRTSTGGFSLVGLAMNSSGNVGIGTTSPEAKFHVQNPSGNANVALFNNTSTSGNVRNIESSIQSNGNNTSSWHFVGTTQTINSWFLYGNGTTSYSSDRRLKKNIETTRDGYLEDLMKLRVVKYNWHNSENGTPKELGLIAQEVEEVFPGLIQEHEMKDVGVRKNIKHSVVEFILIKAIQELKKELDELKAKVG
jgi:hypothetical protein